MHQCIWLASKIYFTGLPKLPHGSVNPINIEVFIFNENIRGGADLPPPLDIGLGLRFCPNFLQDPKQVSVSVYHTKYQSPISKIVTLRGNRIFGKFWDFLVFASFVDFHKGMKI